VSRPAAEPDTCAWRLPAAKQEGSLKSKRASRSEQGSKRAATNARTRRYAQRDAERTHTVTRHTYDTHTLTHTHSRLTRARREVARESGERARCALCGGRFCHATQKINERHMLNFKPVAYTSLLSRPSGWERRDTRGSMTCLCARSVRPLRGGASLVPILPPGRSPRTGLPQKWREATALSLLSAGVPASARQRLRTSGAPARRPCPCSSLRTP